jgi:hypothetical protein
MEWANVITGVLVALFMAIGLPLALRKRKKEGSQKAEQFLHHLQEIGVKASLVEGGVGGEKVRVGRSWGQRSEGVIRIEAGNIDYVNVTSVASQYGVNYSLDYLIRSPGWSGRKKRKKTRMVRKKNSGIRGKVIDIEWKGDDYLSRELNWDYQLKDKLLQVELGGFKSGIWILPEPKYEHTRVRTSYFLPSVDLFDAIDIIAKHIKLG